MERNLTWPDSKQSSKLHRATASRIRYRSLAPTAAAVWDAVAALYTDGCQATARKLWYLVGEIVENQVSENPRQTTLRNVVMYPRCARPCWYRTPKAVTELDDCVHTAPRGVDGRAAG